MAVHLTRIYTRTGDDGTTGLSDFSRVRKTDPRLVAYADTDETNASIGVALALGQLDPVIAMVLARVQNELFDVGADLATPLPAPGTEPAGPQLRVTGEYVERLEADCDAFNADLPKLSSFILPGGTAGAALLHQARTVARRAERSVWALLDSDPDHSNVLTGRYLNRLSDLLFIMARKANDGDDVLWVPGGDR